MVLGLLWCNVVLALTQQSAIDQFLKDRKLTKIEGIWIANAGRIIVIYKSGSIFESKVIRSADVASGSVQFNPITRGSENIYYGSMNCTYTDNSGWTPKTKKTTCNLNINISGNQFKYTYTFPSSANVRPSSNSHVFSRIWPENLSSHNAKFETKDKKKKKVKKKKTLGASGTAFFITDKGHLITNNHVVETCNDNSKITYKKKDISAKILAKDKLLDLALLKVDLRKTDFIHLSKDAPKKLQRIIAAGYPLGKNLSDDLKFTSGIISSLKGLNDDSTLIQIDAALNKGNSGGPIIDEESGDLVAVAVAGLDKSLTESVNFGIKTNSVRNFLDSNQLNLPIKSFFSFGIDAADILEKATVYTYCKN